MALDHLQGCGNAARWGLAMRVGPGYRNVWLGELFGRMRMNMTAGHTWPRTFIEKLVGVTGAATLMSKNMQLLTDLLRF